MKLRAETRAAIAAARDPKLALESEARFTPSLD
jgi:hypothetical protein